MFDAPLGGSSRAKVVAIDPNVVAKAIEATGRQSSEKMERVHGMEWAAIERLSHAVRGVSSAVLAGMVTFLGGKASSVLAALALLASWAALCASVVFGGYGSYRAIALRSFHARVFYVRHDVKAWMAKLDPKMDPKAMIGEVLKLFSEKSDEITDVIFDADTRVRWALRWQLVCFVVAIACLLVFESAGVFEANRDLLVGLYANGMKMLPGAWTAD